MLAYQFDTRILRLNFALNTNYQSVIHFNFNFLVDHSTIAGGFLNEKGSKKQMFDLSTGQLFFKD